MCYSSTASFSASAVLIPLGIYCVKKARELEKPYWLLGLLPLVFGLQQIFEGILWLELEAGGNGTRLPALGFLFFSHFFWLFWIPLACYVIESSVIKRRLFFVFSILGAANGLIMYVPFLFDADKFVVQVMQHSIVYKTTLFYDEYVPRIIVRGLYAVIVLVPLLLCSERYVRLFGVFVMVSIAISTVFFGYAFISVWCYFAALLSLYIVYVMYHLQHNVRI